MHNFELAYQQLLQELVTGDHPLPYIAEDDVQRFLVRHMSADGFVEARDQGKEVTVVSVTDAGRDLLHHHV